MEASIRVCDDGDILITRDSTYLFRELGCQAFQLIWRGVKAIMTNICTPDLACEPSRAADELWQF